MTDHAIEVLRAADPARNMPPLSSAVRERLRASILSADVEPPADRWHAVSNGRLPRRRVLLAVAAMLVAVIPLGGWAYLSYFNDSDTVIHEFRAAMQRMTMPTGVHWVEPALPADATYGGKYGYIEAWHQSTNAWLREWAVAHGAGDTAREQAALTAVERQVDSMPLHKVGDSEETGGFDKGSVDYMKALVEKMRQGDLPAIEQYLQVNP